MTANKGVAILDNYPTAIGKATKLKVSASNSIVSDSKPYGEGAMSEEIELTSAALPSKPFDMVIIKYGPEFEFDGPDRNPKNLSPSYYLYF
jgi:hypothetical protein